ITRVSFISLSDVLEQDYVRTAYGKGLVSRMVMNHHVIRNAAVPVLTTLGVSLRFSVSSLPVVELFFGWAGLGFTLLKSISRQDDDLTVTLFLCLGILFILTNILLEVGYRLIDPRLRESPEHVKREQAESIISKLNSILADVRKLISIDPIKNWLMRRKAPAAPNPFRAVLEERGESTDEFNDGREGERRAWLQGTLGNVSLILGVLLIGVLLAVIAFNTRLAPHSPYTTRGLTIEDGEFRVPPFEPDENYPWGTDVLGRDVMSLVLAGAQQTLLLATVVMLARMVIGFVLGAVAGWMNGGWLDRLLLGASEVIAAFPTLLLAMMLILALGIRQGLQPFVIALCFVGWGEVMLFVRGEVMKIRPMLYIESAVAIGLRMPRMILWHVLPNLIPALVSLAALEMGAVLILLGELGFIGIFIGGGAFAELDVVAAPFHYSDVPEWGALLSNVRAFARTYAWMAIYPSLAFFVAILGFNFLGEGIRRMIDIVGVPIMRLFNRYTLAFGLVATLGVMWVRGNTGSLDFYQKQASEFDGENAMINVAALSHPSLEGRALGSDGMDVAAEYIANRFESLGLQAAGENLTYLQPRKRDYESLNTVPRMAIGDGGPSLVYRQDYVERPSDYRNLGLTLAKVRFVAFGDLVSAGTSFRQYQALQGRDYSDEIILVLSERDADFLRATPRAGMLVVAEDPLDLQRRYTLSAVDPRWRLYGTGRQRGQDAPMFWISEAAADRLLKDTGNTVAELRGIAGNLSQDEVFEIPTNTTVGMEVNGSIHEQVTVNHVVGHLPGAAGRIAGVSSEAQLDDQVIVVMAQYDSSPINPDGTFFPAANDNASGIAVMLETIRTIQESGYQPYKTFIFVAYSGEGLEGGARYIPEAAKFLQTKFGFSKNLKVEAVIELRGLGYKEGEELVLLTGG
ncbi:MAG: ABC transporter permease subunit, partial [Anaerolineales bacterium]|nr:ABC transporter permease subunit [Anaerolineales bacterium]